MLRSRRSKRGREASCEATGIVDLARRRFLGFFPGRGQRERKRSGEGEREEEEAARGGPVMLQGEAPQSSDGGGPGRPAL